MSIQPNYDLDVTLGEPEDIDDVEETKTFKDEEQVIKYGDAGWNDFIMKQFTPDELYNDKHPTLNGMRRVTEKILGQVVTSEIVDLKSSLDHTSNGRAFCHYKIVINNFLGSRHYRTFSGAAGAFDGNTDPIYAIYPEAIAEGRAEARAYRKALMLKNAAADEIKGMEKSSFESVIPSVKEEYNEKEAMSSTQMVVIETKCNKLKINKDKLIESYKKDKNVSELTKADAIELTKLISSYQNDSKNIPEEIKL